MDYTIYQFSFIINLETGDGNTQVFLQCVPSNMKQRADDVDDDVRLDQITDIVIVHGRYYQQLHLVARRNPTVLTIPTGK
jgi:hypothetical protein